MAAERESEQEFKERLNQKLQNSGEIERLKKTLRERLQNCGWTDQMKSICKGKKNKKKLMSYLFDECTFRNHECTFLIKIMLKMISKNK